jgi:type II secretory pathway component PulK
MRITLDPSKLSPPRATFRERFDRVLLVDGCNEISPGEWDRLRSHPEFARIASAVCVVENGNKPTLLAYINTAKAYQLEAVPGIGRESAARLLESKPPGGWTSLEDMAPHLQSGALDKIKAWGKY